MQNFFSYILTIEIIKDHFIKYEITYNALSIFKIFHVGTKREISTFRKLCFVTVKCNDFFEYFSTRCVQHLAESRHY